MDLAGPRGAELDTAENEALAEHLDQCSDCNRLAQMERLADEQLGTAMRDIRMPGFLRNQILARLDLERNSWYRRWPQRHPRVAAAAAAIFLLCVGFTWYMATRPGSVPDLDALLAEANGKLGSSAEQVEQWFAMQGVRTVAPPDFNYLYFTDAAQEKFVGKLVPRLLFIARNHEQAHVYILSDRQFDLKALLGARVGSGAYTIEFRAHPTNPNIGYLVKYTGGSLEAFLQTLEVKPVI
jgi:hypothetical protein